MKFTFQVQNAKNMFDPAKFNDPIRRAKRKILFGFGAYCMKIAKNSIKTKPAGIHSKPGEIPFGHENATRYKDFIFFAVDESRGDVVIGGELLPRKNPSPMPGTLEYGGPAERKLGFQGRDGVAVEMQPARPHMRIAFDIAVKKNLAKLIEHSIVKQ